LNPTKSTFAKPKIPTFEPYVDENVVAKFLQLESRRVLDMARKKQIPAHPIGNLRKTWRSRLSEIEAHFSPRSARQASCMMGPAVPGTQEG
jgi:hypothetical protein